MLSLAVFKPGFWDCKVNCFRNKCWIFIVVNVNAISLVIGRAISLVIGLVISVEELYQDKICDKIRFKRRFIPENHSFYVFPNL